MSQSDVTNRSRDALGRFANEYAETSDGLGALASSGTSFADGFFCNLAPESARRLVALERLQARTMPPDAKRLIDAMLDTENCIEAFTDDDSVSIVFVRCHGDDVAYIKTAWGMSDNYDQTPVEQVINEVAAPRVAAMMGPRFEALVNPCFVAVVPNAEDCDADEPAEVTSVISPAIDGEQTDMTILQQVSDDGLRDAALFDAVIGNLDRHYGNAFLLDDGNDGPSLRLYDHGSAFPGTDYYEDEDDEDGWQSQSVFADLAHSRGLSDLTDDHRETLTRLLDSDLSELTAVLGQDKVNAMRDRCKRMLEGGRILATREMIHG